MLPKVGRWGHALRKGKTGAPRPPYIDHGSWRIHLAREKRREAYLEYLEELTDNANNKYRVEEGARPSGEACPAAELDR